MPLLRRVAHKNHVHPPKLVVTLHPHSTLQWHPPKLAVTFTIPHHYNGTLQWHHDHSPKVGRHPPPPTIAHYNGTLRWHPAMAPRPQHPAMAPWCHVQSAKVVRRPPPLLEVRTPIAIAIWGKKNVPFWLRQNFAAFRIVILQCWTRRRACDFTTRVGVGVVGGEGEVGVLGRCTN